MPAVSINVYLSPLISSVDVTKSVVVPGIFVTIETSLFDMLFIKLDLPVFVLPIIATRC